MGVQEVDGQLRQRLLKGGLSLPKMESSMASAKRFGKGAISSSRASMMFPSWRHWSCLHAMMMISQPRRWVRTGVSWPVVLSAAF